VPWLWMRFKKRVVVQSRCESRREGTYLSTASTHGASQVPMSLPTWRELDAVERGVVELEAAIVEN
jgi:hypothetical protein